nr:hypothetical protein [Tanacetum cinerariifolium]
MGDEHIDTILETKSNEFIKPSVENLVRSPSESEDKRECDVPLYDDFTTFSNLLFDADDDFSSSNNKSFSDEDIPKKIYSNPLFDEEIISIKIDPHHLNAESDLIESLLNQDSSIISSSKIDSLLDEFAGELILLKSIPPGIDEADCDPEEEIHLIEKLFVEIILLMELVQSAILELEIHSFMVLIQSLSMKFKYLVNHTLNIQNELFINELIQQKLQKENENAQLFLAIAITLDLPTVEPKDSLRMGDEHLDTILETKSNEFIKSSVENLVPSPSESEDERECDVPLYDDFTTFFNLLFDADDDFSSSNNKSFSDEDIPKKIYSNPLFDEEIISIKIDPHHLNAESDLIESMLNQDSSIISSSKIDSLLDEFAGELILLKSIPPGIDEADCDPEEEIYLIEKLLYDNSSPRLPEEFIFENSDAAIESFSPSPIPVGDSDSLRDEIDLSLTPDDSMPPGIEDDDYDSEGGILIFEELLSNDSLSLLKNESFHFDIPSSPRPHAKPPDDDEI